MTMQINRQALRSIIPDEAHLLFAEQIPPEYQSDALGRRTGTADALVFALDRRGQRRAQIRR